MAKDNKVTLQVAENFSLEIDCDTETGMPDIGYIKLPDHPGQSEFGLVKKSVRLFDLVGNYFGPDIHLDFDENNKLIGIDLDFERE